MPVFPTFPYDSSSMPAFPDFPSHTLTADFTANSTLPGAKKGKAKKTVPGKNTQKKQEKPKVRCRSLEDKPIGLQFHRLGEREGEPKIFKVGRFLLLLVSE